MEAQKSYILTELSKLHQPISPAILWSHEDQIGKIPEKYLIQFCFANVNRLTKEEVEELIKIVYSAKVQVLQVTMTDGLRVIVAMRLAVA